MKTLSEFIDYLYEGPMTRREISKHLKDKGWSMERTTKHDIWRHPKSIENIAVPRHGGDLKYGTIQKILKQAKTA